MFSEWQPDYEEARQCYPHIEFIHEWNDEIYKAIRPEDRNLLIIDDQMEEAGNSKSLANLFTKGSHHKNLSIFHLIQNMYHKGGSQRTMSLNSHYNIIFKNPRDATQIRTLAYQMHPGNSKWFLDAFADATSRPYGYLVLDNHPRSIMLLIILLFLILLKKKVKLYLYLLLIPAIAAGISALAGVGGTVASNVIQAKKDNAQLEEQQRHNRELEAAVKQGQ